MEKLIQIISIAVGVLIGIIIFNLVGTSLSLIRTLIATLCLGGAAWLFCFLVLNAFLHGQSWHSLFGKKSK